MTEIAEHWGETEQEAPLVALTTALHEENERLVHLAEACRDHARQLGEREAGLSEREQRLAEAETTLGHRRAELEQREQHVNELARRAEEAGARLAEAAEREAQLAALGGELLERYRTHE